MQKKERISKDFQYSQDQGFLLLIKAVDRLEFENRGKMEECVEGASWLRGA